MIVGKQAGGTGNRSQGKSRPDLPSISVVSPKSVITLSKSPWPAEACVGTVHTHRYSIAMIRSEYIPWATMLVSVCDGLDERDIGN